MKIILNSILNKRPFIYDTRPFVETLFKEDATNKDYTTLCIKSNRNIISARIVAKSLAVIAGIEVMKEIFHYRDRNIVVKTHFKDGDIIKPGEELCKIRGKTSSILQAERIALNVLQRMSGVATETFSLCKLVKGTKVRILNTRKTTPGMRYLEKYATTVGGALNHRLNLADGILIKENHIMAAGSIKKAVEYALHNKPDHLLIEVEVKNIPELKEVLSLPVDIIMLDNFSLDKISAAVRITNRRKPLEVSGNVTAKNIRKISLTGVDYISVGAITHSAKASDFSLLLYDDIYD